MSIKKPLLTFVGVATEDSIAVVDHYPAPNARVEAESVTFGGGGPAATAAVAAARLGIQTALVAAVGEDEAGDHVRRRLESEGVDTTGIQTVSGGNTARSVVVISGEDRSRAISNVPGPPITFSRRDEQLLAASSWVHVDQHGWGAARSLLGRDSGPRLSVDAGNHIPGFTMRGTSLFVPTMEALSARYPNTSSSDVEALIGRAIDDGASQVAVTDGGNGSYGTVNGRLVHAKAPRVEIVSTLGAGDVFHGALLAALIHQEAGEVREGLAAALSYATAAASLSCRAVDGRSMIPTHDEVLALIND